MARYGLAHYDSGNRYDETDAHTRNRSNRTMASNPLPDDRDSLFTLAEDMADGAHQHEAAIGIQQNTEARVRAALAAARATELDFSTTMAGKLAATTALQTADSNGKAFIGNARRRLAKFFGDSYHAQWGLAGWPNNSLAMPSRQDDRMNLLASLKDYFTANPAHASAEMEVTAAIANTRFQALSDARANSAQCLTLVGQKKQLLDAAVVNLRKRLRGLITELETLLEDDDPRWHAFGLSMPGDPDLPDIPEQLVLTPGAAGSVLADWADALRAARYRVWLQRVGVDADFVAVQTVNDSDATLAGLTTGQTIKVRITAANDSGESQPGDEVPISVP